ncbi:hypothetical protein [Thalassobacillus sp. C254]|uniref:hypothetical protein n=1 Tax=Thalassobacillus sp. C254 TaxID=1225341 RepID=UPI0012ED6D31|nr:hypothetical protein [Thalassobacillus sp. C254]
MSRQGLKTDVTRRQFLNGLGKVGAQWPFLELWKALVYLLPLLPKRVVMVVFLMKVIYQH